LAVEDRRVGPGKKIRRGGAMNRKAAEAASARSKVPPKWGNGCETLLARERKKRKKGSLKRRAAVDEE